MFASAYGLARIHTCKMYVARHILNELEASFDIWVPYLITKTEMKNLIGIARWNSSCKFFPELMQPNVISDDKYYSARMFAKNKNVIITPQHFSSSEDLAILALCQHSIITSGSLGWWSAFLAGGNVTYHVSDMPNQSTTYDCNSANYLPSWLPISTS
ncbi:unnamed protein product [Adineta steineri]|uniref:L-Fucosyltransferase n=1 Tax=Adineta steineri TaxID=433720 RepID=A0A819PE56_9BILA|nr:unnamed protein product [Adineta steineri]